MSSLVTGLDTSALFRKPLLPRVSVTLPPRTRSQLRTGVGLPPPGDSVTAGRPTG